ncbi:hypothetical protein KVR01_004498 [Diaporthe batatas]|uniref:uncharacterized protein n=1 Tax=Diaporthe batatas TaxID=748121 RepID=UPI001D0563A4|nr:uncharacterized protein KVR01_004498 [Diaporthe batatas]KAG8165946.1 hypothetical protein KVR01_004498 [Diaporthe batatas]
MASNDQFEAAAPTSQPRASNPFTVEHAHWSMYDDDTGQIHPHEPLEHYGPGGYHPVALGDTFQDARYTVLRKLGHGGYSTVWLASDSQGIQSGVPRRRFVSIKIKRASSSNMGLYADPEVVKLRALENHYLKGPQDNPRSFVMLLDCFVHNGPNGTHNCLVTELLGPSLSNVMRVYRDLEQVLRPDTILRASRQILDGVHFAHQAGFAHGDISAANIVFTCNAILDDKDDDLLEVLGDLYVAKAKTSLPSPHAPKELVATSRWGLWNDGPEEDIRFIDWGAAFPVDQTVSQEFMPQPIDLRAPETFFNGHLTCKIDLWRAGCVESIFGARYNDRHFFLEQVIKKVGPLPEDWQSKFEEIRQENKDADADEANTPWEKFADTFEDRRQSLFKTYTDDDEDVSWKYERDDHTEYDFECLKSILLPMQQLLQHEPEKRISAKEAAHLIEWTDHRRVGGEISVPVEHQGELDPECREDNQ